MSMYSDVRYKLHAIVKAFFAASYPTMEVNYPKRWITDVEHITVPFASVEFNYSSKGLSLPAHDCREVSGLLVVNMFARSNSGEKIFTDFTDALDAYLGLETINGITIYEVNPYDNSRIPGFDGVMNVANFKTDYFNT